MTVRSIRNPFHSMQRIALILAAAALPLTGHAQYVESQSCGAYSSIAGNGSAVVLNTVSNCDDCTELVNLPFSFMWSGSEPITAVQVSSNGQINIDSGDTNSNCCSADPVEVGGAYADPRIAVAQEDLDPGDRGTIYSLDTGSSFIIEYNDLDFFGGGGDMNAQVEMFPTGIVQVRFGSPITSDDDAIAVGLEDDTAMMPWATPASGAPFGAGGIAPAGGLPQNTCRAFIPASLPSGGANVPIPTLSPAGLAALLVLMIAGSWWALRRHARARID